MDFDSGVDDNNDPWFSFHLVHLNDYDGEAYHELLEERFIPLSPLKEDGRKPLAGIAP